MGASGNLWTVNNGDDNVSEITAASLASSIQPLPPTETLCRLLIMDGNVALEAGPFLYFKRKSLDLKREPRSKAVATDDLYRSQAGCFSMKNE
ncbi:MAG: hypothetical protein ACRECH_01850 [Nitrososphaerales archaeon]